MKTFSLGYSPCPNDTFLFYAIANKKIDTRGLNFKEVLLDVETLNQMALRSELDITKTSYHALGYLLENYCLLRSGGAIGKNCGPLIVSKKDFDVQDLNKKKIAIPGRLTTANLLLQLFISESNIPNPLFPQFIEIPFHKIMDSVVKGEVDVGLVIHEGRFTYPSYGLKKIIDLGEWWEKNTGLPLPLGCIIAKRNIGKDIIKKIESVIRKSIEYSLNNRNESRSYIKQYAQELEDNVIEQHINLYVNEYSLDIKEEGLLAVKELLRKAELAGIVKKKRDDLLCVM
ncbi:MAG: menaquinone biosynthesis family protein [Thermodesulfovibrionales bacterium]